VSCEDTETWRLGGYYVRWVSAGSSLACEKFHKLLHFRARERSRAATRCACNWARRAGVIAACAVTGGVCGVRHPARGVDFVVRVRGAVVGWEVRYDAVAVGVRSLCGRVRGILFHVSRAHGAHDATG